MEESGLLSSFNELGYRGLSQRKTTTELGDGRLACSGRARLDLEEQVVSLRSQSIGERSLLGPTQELAQR